MSKMVLMLPALLIATAAAAADALVSVGVAKVDITPNYPVRMQGYAARKAEATNAAQRIWAKALAIGDKEPALFITVDNCGVQGTMVDDLARRLGKDGIKPERVTVCSSHTHSAPAVTGFAPNLFVQDLPAEEMARIERYTSELADKLEQVARAALKDRRPGKLGWSQGEVRFAKNRRTQGGPVDHALPVMRATDADGKTRAIVANYACHCTTLGGEFNQIHGDWAGYAQEFVERDHPGAIALISIGCGADANPHPRGSLEHARQHGEEMAKEVKALLGRTFAPLSATVECGSKVIQLPFQKHFTREQWTERAKQGGIVGYHARKNLARLDRGESLPSTLPYRVQTWTFGNDLALVFLAGEVVVDYSIRLKKEFDAARLWITAYANDVPCYIPSPRILQEGGYEAEGSLWYYDRPARLAPECEDLILKTVHELLPKRFVHDAKKAEMPPPKSAAEAVATFRTKAHLEIELVASEPQIVDPVAIDWDADGRLWVVEMHDYPVGMDGNYKPGGRVKVLSDRDGDGKYEEPILFLDGLPFPTGIMAWKRGALICAAPDILYAEDTDGDGKADVVRTNFTGFATHNYQARVNGLTWGLDGWVYGASGLFGGKISSFSGKRVDLGGRDFRMNPDTGDIEPVAGLSQQSRVRDDWGNWFGCDNSTLIWHFPLADHYVKRNPHVPAPDPRVYPVKDAEPNRLYPISRTLERFNDPSHVNRTTSACGLEIYRDELLGTDYNGSAFVCEPVHNLVHRLVLEPTGATFAARRAADEQRSEFLASTDNWFRPVQVRTGPDGALWIVDMYRFVIEHPRWIPTNRLAELEVRAGADKGRIYRMYPRGQKPRAIQRVSALDSDELAAALDTPNGPTRDLVHREILARGNPLLERLSKIATNGSNAAARGQALWALARYEVRHHHAFEDRHAGVRRQALTLYDDLPEALLRRHFVTTSSEPKPGLLEGQIAFQMALSMGERHDATGGEILSLLARHANRDKWLRAAIVSSAIPHIGTLLDAVSPTVDSDLHEKLIMTAVRAGNTHAVERVLSRALPQPDEKPTDEQFRLAGIVLDARPSALLPDHFGNIIRVARDAARSGSSAAIPLLGREPGQLAADVELLIGLAAHNADALQRIRQLRGRSVADTILKSWPVLSPALRGKFVDLLVTREEWAKELGEAINRHVVSVSEIPVATRARLGLKTTGNAERADVVSNYAVVARLPAKTSNGAAIFDKNCASCHAFRNHGHEVGPNLAEFAGKSIEDFLVAILDPNSVIEPKTVAYEVETRDGRSFHGIVRGETATSLTLVQSGGVRETVLRGDIKELRASSLSLMPEGLEQAISPQDMADLIGWLKQGATGAEVAAGPAR